MSRDILDLIDHVVDEHELLSTDAMRWAPQAPDPTPDGPPAVQTWTVRAQVVDWLDYWSVGRLTEWQYELVGRIFKVPMQMLLSRAEVERRVRVSRMHTEYRRRTRRSVHR